MKYSTAIPLAAAAGAAAGVGLWLCRRYAASDEMRLPVREFTNAQCALDPARRSVRHGRYVGRQLNLIRRDGGRFDFVFDSAHPHVATIAFRDVDAGLMTPRQPDWTRDDPRLEKIALIEREWNRQQVLFERG